MKSLKRGMTLSMTPPPGYAGTVGLPMLFLVGLYILIVPGLLFFPVVPVGGNGGPPVLAQEDAPDFGGDHEQPAAEGHARRGVDALLERLPWDHEQPVAEAHARATRLGIAVLLCVGPMTLGGAFLVLNLVWLARRRWQGPQPPKDRVQPPRSSAI